MGGHFHLAINRKCLFFEADMKISVRLVTVFQVCFIFATLFAHSTLMAEQQSVRPGINRHYQNPDWQQWVNTFERPGREVYDMRHAIVDATGIRQGMSVADIGAGTGLFTRLFAQKVGPEGRVFAVDISKSFVENILRSAGEFDLDNVTGVVNSDKDTMLPPASIDLAFLVDTYHHFEYPASMLSSIHQSLKANGRLVVIDFRRDPQHSSRWVMSHVRAGKALVIDEITRAGFRLIDDKPLLKTNYYLVFSRLQS
jgi:ubiquinone/menaquinone biosynthesis C-methylase UbiE